MDTRLSSGTFGVIEGDGATREVHVCLPGTEQLGGPLATETKTQLECVFFRPRGKTIDTPKKGPKFGRSEVSFTRPVELRQGRSARQWPK
jgi:hypothetical protein